MPLFSIISDVFLTWAVFNQNSSIIRSEWGGGGGGDDPPGLDSIFYKYNPSSYQYIWPGSPQIP